ncbi:MAG: Gfo/Idh/MocA family oxidoreductase [Abditibacteriota bacterium]|nr:Gfo/Idh/MocA family oxidoreductase [Abditibacteriota bacterium]
MMKAGVIGCGTISKFHVDGFREAGCELGWFCDIDPARSGAYQALYPGSKTTADYRDVLADPEVSVVAVCTLTSLHNEVVKAAIAAGKAVICEKTLGMNAADALDMCLFAEEKKAFLSTGYMKRFFPAVQKAEELLKGRRIVSVYAKTYQPFPGLYLGDPSQQKATGDFLRDYMGGGVVVCGGSHIMDLLHFFCGLPTACAGQLDTVPGSDDFDRDANALFWFENGAVAHFEAYWHEYAKGGFEQNGWDEEIRINTPDGAVIVKTPLWHKPENNAARVSWLDAVTGEYTEYRYEAVNSFTLHEIEEVKRVAEGKAPAVDGWDGYVADVMIDAVKLASRTGDKVQIAFDKAMPRK